MRLHKVHLIWMLRSTITQTAMEDFIHTAHPSHTDDSVVIQAFLW